MTAVNQGTQLPVSLTTLERIIVWAMSAFVRLHPDETYLERNPQSGDNGIRDVAEAGTLTDADGNLRFVARVSIVIDQSALSSTVGKFWTFALENGNIALPTSFEAD